MKLFSKLTNVFLLTSALNMTGCEDQRVPVQTEIIEPKIQAQIEAQIRQCNELDQHGVKMMWDIFNGFRRDTHSQFDIVWDEEDEIYKAFIPMNAPKGADWNIARASEQSFRDAVKWQDTTRHETSCALKKSLSFKEQFERTLYYYKASSIPSHHDNAVASISANAELSQEGFAMNAERLPASLLT
jgi:hypothetical protein